MGTLKKYLSSFFGRLRRKGTSAAEELADQHDIDTLSRAVVIRKEIDRSIELQRKLEEQPHLATRLEALDFSTRTSNCLRRKQLLTLHEIASCRPDELLSIKGLGRRSLNEVRLILSRHGLMLREDPKALYDLATAELERLGKYDVLTDVFDWPSPKDVLPNYLSLYSYWVPDALYKAGIEDPEAWLREKGFEPPSGV